MNKIARIYKNGRGIIGFPNLIILDEPTNALDTKGIIELKKLIEKVSEAGKIVAVKRLKNQE